MSIADSRCYAAIGVMTIPKNIQRRHAARQTWMTAANVGSTVVVRFLVRALGLEPTVLAEAQQEHAVHKDVLMLPVASGHTDQPPRGRVLTLHAWMKSATTVCPTARWVCKADDDVYIVTVDWEAQLRLIRPLRENSAIMHGKIVWHNWNVDSFMPHSFDYSYNWDHWRRVIDYLGGNARRARGEEERKRFEVCRKQGARRCEWCTTEAECTGPFPFVTGWLITMSAPLAQALANSSAVEAEVERAQRLSRNWGPPILEDVWLGSVVHRMLADRPVLFVQMDFAHQFNGDWPSVCEAEKRARNCGFEFNTTIVYHNKRTRMVHKHVTQEAGAHVPPQPALKCAASSEVKYLNGQIGNFAEYVRRAQRPRGSGLCVLLEPRFLVPPGSGSRLFHNP
tara:strand:+ start:34 stop:1218 length:1185 start_codon:yes stop_codon:yes gene_type:complete